MKYTLKKMNAVSLFSGMGGDSLGMKIAGVNVIGYVEHVDIIQQTHNINFPESILIGGNIINITDDIIKTYIGIDIVFAGFPCQGFSNAGKKLADDQRNNLFYEFVRFVRLTEPKFIIGENVKGLLTRTTPDNTRYIDIIVREFNDIGYDVKYQVMRCSGFSTPQKRDRLFIIGCKRDLCKTLSFPEPNQTIHGLRNIINFSLENAIRVDKSFFKNINISKIVYSDNDQDPTGTCHPYLELLVSKKLLSFGKRISPHHGEIIDIDLPCKTIICTYARQPRLFVPLRNNSGYFLRCLTPFELKQIQGFPSDFKVCGNTVQQITQIGNAVPPPVVSKIITHLINL